MSNEPPARDDSYVVDPESPTEMARLLKQHRFITNSMGELYPREIDLSQMHDALDLCCGPGGWLLDMAYAFPKVRFVGVDISRTMIDYAHAEARVQWLDNADFGVMDIMKPLDFPDNSFDLVNARFLFGVLPKAQWPSFLKECLRVVRPGGIIQLTEPEWTVSNSLAFEQMSAMFTQALKAVGHSFSVDGRHVGLTVMMARLLRDAGCVRVQKKPYQGELSHVEEEYFEANYQNYLIAFQLLKPFILQMGLTTQEEFERTYLQMQTDMLGEDFCGMGYALTAWGFKPE